MKKPMLLPSYTSTVVVVDEKDGAEGSRHPEVVVAADQHDHGFHEHDHQCGNLKDRNRSLKRRN
jgi:hypothetical protein